MQKKEKKVKKRKECNVDYFCRMGNSDFSIPFIYMYNNNNNNNNII